MLLIIVMMSLLQKVVLFLTVYLLDVSKFDLFNYAGDNALSKGAGAVELVTEALKTDDDNAIKLCLFANNDMKVNPEKFQIMLLKPFHCKTDLASHIEIDDLSLEFQRNVKLLGIIIDDKLKFDVQVYNMCSRASGQLNVMYRFQKISKETEKKSNS